MDRFEGLELTLDLFDKRFQIELFLVIDLNFVPVSDVVQKLIVTRNQQNCLGDPASFEVFGDQIGLYHLSVLIAPDGLDAEISLFLILILDILQLFVDNVVFYSGTGPCHDGILVI